MFRLWRCFTILSYPTSFWTEVISTPEQRWVTHYSRRIFKYANAFHTQLRVGQSYLNAHGFKINLKEDDLCLCHRSETTSHYFLDCFLYQQERAILFNKISEYLPRFQALSKSKKLEIILQNIEPDQRNVPVVFAVQNYILKTKRFSTPPQPPSPPPHHAPTS